MKLSAGILLYRMRAGSVEVLLVHPGGPFWARKDDGAWFIAKGEVEEGEALVEAAKREFCEELGREVPEGELISLGSLQNKSRKVIHVWAVEGELDVSAIRSNTFSLEWPPRSGKQAEFPEIDRAEYFPIESAFCKMSPAERPFLERLASALLERQR